jgi:hypothetical protein
MEEGVFAISNSPHLPYIEYKIQAAFNSFKKSLSKCIIFANLF